MVMKAQPKSFGFSLPCRRASSRTGIRSTFCTVLRRAQIEGSFKGLSKPCCHNEKNSPPPFLVLQRSIQPPTAPFCIQHPAARHPFVPVLVDTNTLVSGNHASIASRFRYPYCRVWHLSQCDTRFATIYLFAPQTPRNATKVR
ncbi:hypothetical protein SCLCIDRAFT_790480 [Scleroderma citrinum Foug A]|uniref:Uncharacterized protein n=1 Tax=Scleroderma citrinum Foug A TaxID=1036808 RepID=A0A0C2ZMD2_9AGAM|nr:hypothetical protein SCLCIDRAFT_790480 [Scleroderma citrinum Foug A]